MNGLFSGGRPTARYISAKSNIPAKLPSRVKMPSVNVAPINSRPSIKSQSTIAIPERPLKKPARGPCTPNSRKPEVGELPKSHDLSGEVAKPSPKSLSKKAHKKTKPIKSRNRPRPQLNLFDSIFTTRFF